MGREVVRQHAWHRLAIYHEPVAAEHDRRLYTFTLPERSYEIADCRHIPPHGKTAAKLDRPTGEVKQRQSLELLRAQEYCKPPTFMTLCIDPADMIRSMRAVALLGCAAFLAACEDPTARTANAENTTATVTLYAFNGTAITDPIGLLFANTSGALEPVGVRLTPAFFFDIAFDFDAAGNALAYPVGLVGSNLSVQRQVGLQLLEAQFDSVLRAPSRGYTYNAPLAIAVGDVVVIESNNPPICSGSFFPRSYSKMQVMALDPVTRTVRVNALTNPNCGFRGLAPGLPTE